MSPDQVEFTFWHEGALLARFALGAGEFVVGRADSCEVIIDLDGMAPQQMRMRVGEEILVDNLDPGEGTFLDGEPLIGTATWNPAQAIKFGGCGGTLKIEEATEPAVPDEIEVPPSDREELSVLIAERTAWQERQVELETELRESRAALSAAAEKQRTWRDDESTLNAEIEALREEAAVERKQNAERAEAVERSAEDLRSWSEREAKLKSDVRALRNEAAAERKKIELAQQMAEDARQAWAAERARMETSFSEASKLAAEAAAAEREMTVSTLQATLQARWTAEQREERAKVAAERGRHKERAAQMEQRLAQLEEKLQVRAIEQIEESDTLEQLRLEVEEERKSFEFQLGSLQEQHERERAELQEKLEKAEAKAGAESTGEAATGKPSGSNDLISLANRVLFKKLAQSTNLEHENEELRKELKQREIALVAAWSDRQRAEERAAQLAKEAADADAPESTIRPEEPLNRQISAIAFAVAFAMLLTIAGLGIWVARLGARAHHAEAIVAVVKPTAPQLHEQALELIREGNFKEALGKLACAIALQPALDEYRFTEGDAHESLLQLDAARAAYEKGLELNPSNAAARANRDLCRRILATRRGVDSAESLYALHTIMMDQKRLPEALRMAHRLANDRPLLHRTLSAILEEARLPARLQLNSDGSFDLDLSGPGRPNLSVLTDIPLRSLKLARSDVVDLSALKGLALKHLDLAETRVHDISPLEGMPLLTLDLSKTDVSNLFPLEKMRLKELSLNDTPVSDISVLQGMPLERIRMAGTRVRNLAALAGSPVRSLELTGTRVADISPLQHLPIERLQLDDTGVVDLTPLVGAPLSFLTLAGTAVDDLRPLQKLPLRELTLGRCDKLKDLRPLAACASLERLVLPKQATAVDFLRKLPSLRFLSYEKMNPLGDSDESAQEFWAAVKVK